MKPVVPPVDVELIEAELTQEAFVRKTNNGNNEIYIVTGDTAPHVLREIGRLREITFRDAGGGTGKDIDLDIFDDGPHPFKQLFVWNPVEKEIVGGYRFLRGDDFKLDDSGIALSPTARLFNLSSRFINDYLPYTIELGRSFVQPRYQPTFNLRRGLYSLDNIWDGLGAIIVDNPDVKYLFGKITMYPQYQVDARDAILFFMNKFFPGDNSLVYAKKPLFAKGNTEGLDQLFSAQDYEDNYKKLVRYVRDKQTTIPPLVNAYMNLSSSMKTFGTAINSGFGNVEETCILMTIADVYDVKKARHINTYNK